MRPVYSSSWIMLPSSWAIRSVSKLFLGDERGLSILLLYQRFESLAILLRAQAAQLLKYVYTPQQSEGHHHLVAKFRKVLEMPTCPHYLCVLEWWVILARFSTPVVSYLLWVAFMLTGAKRENTPTNIHNHFFSFGWLTMLSSGRKKTYSSISSIIHSLLQQQPSVSPHRHLLS